MFAPANDRVSASPHGYLNTNNSIPIRWFKAFQLLFGAPQTSGLSNTCSASIVPLRSWHILPVSPVRRSAPMFHVEHSGASAALKRLTFEHLFSPRTAWLTHRHDCSPYTFYLKTVVSAIRSQSNSEDVPKRFAWNTLLILKATLIKPESASSITGPDAWLLFHVKHFLMRPNTVF